MYKPHRDGEQQRFDGLMTTLVMILVFTGLIFAGVYGMSRSQLASPDDGPVRFDWIVKGTVHGCLVLEKGKPNRACKEFTSDELQHFPMHYEDPHKSFPGYFNGK